MSLVFPWRVSVVSTAGMVITTYTVTKLSPNAFIGWSSFSKKTDPSAEDHAVRREFRKGAKMPVHLPERRAKSVQLWLAKDPGSMLFTQMVD
ncbi:hypothetical protein [Ruegeria sp. EL01]|uniref:hypothetical protein n=1 Tax=Ruegeria sp. EL01 TaxID=2107578 RepID=UPI0013C3E5CD|nr:hypothetical protein [Ruegeria sp. EL01]